MTAPKDSVLVAVDSMTLVWGIKKQGTQSQLQQARFLFDQLEDENAQVLLPAIALSEYLTPIPQQLHNKAIAELKRRFIIAPFDVKCASLAATLFVEGKEMRKSDGEMGQTDARKCLRADALIVATAVCHGARVLYSGDSRCRKLAQKVPNLDVRDLPTIPNSLWGFGEDRA